MGLLVCIASLVLDSRTDLHILCATVLMTNHGEPRLHLIKRQEGIHAASPELMLKEPGVPEAAPISVAVVTIATRIFPPRPLIIIVSAVVVAPR